MTIPPQSREREAIRIMELIGQAFDLVGLRPLPNHWDDCSGREKDAFLELANKLVPAEAPPAAAPPVGVERLAACLAFVTISRDLRPSTQDLDAMEEEVKEFPGRFDLDLDRARRAIALLHPQPAGRGEPEPMPHTSHEWKEESNPTGWHGEIGCTACGIGVGDPGTYEPCPASATPTQSGSSNLEELAIQKAANVELFRRMTKLDDDWRRSRGLPCTVDVLYDKLEEAMDGIIHEPGCGYELKPIRIPCTCTQSTGMDRLFLIRDVLFGTADFEALPAPAAEGGRGQ